MKKIYEDSDAVLDGVLLDGIVVAFGGFGRYGIPETPTIAPRRGR